MIQHGRFKYSKHMNVNKHKYYVEEVDFNGYQEALHKFYKIVADTDSLGEAKQTKYDLYDWTYIIFEFENCIIELRHLRGINSVRLIKSNSPLSLEEYEQDSPELIRIK